MASQGSNGRHDGTLDLATRELGVSSGSGKKRKGRDVFAPALPDPDPISAPDILLSESTATRQPQQIQATGGSGGRKLLAGYLAHEFLTKGTLFGHHWDPAAAAAARPQSARERHRPPPLPDPPQQEEEERKAKKKNLAYAEVAYLLKAEGVGIPGVVNPTQLVRWLQM